MARYGGAGFLPYGVDDDSIIFRSPLTTEASYTSPEIGTALSFGIPDASGEFSSQGWNPKGAGVLRINQLTGFADLDIAGQMHFEMDREWICRNDPTNGTYGKEITGAREVAISALFGSGGSDQVFLNNKVVDKSYMVCNLTGMLFTPKTFTDWKINTGETINGMWVHSAGKSDKITVNIGWWGSPEGGLVVCAIDGLIYGAGVRSLGSDSNILQNIYLGSDRGLSDFMEDNHIKNLQISNKPPHRTINRLLRKVSILSDSMWEGTQETFGGAYRDALAIHNLRRYFLQNGFLAGDITLDVNTGYTLRTTGSNDLFDATNMAALEAQRAPIIEIRGGTNDGLQELTIDSAWDAELKTNLTTILGWESTERIIIETVPTQMSTGSAYTATRKALVNQMNAYINALPDWNDKVYVADTYNACGAENPPDETFIGQLNGDFDNVHFAGLGHKLHAFEVGKTILRAMK